MTLYQKYCFINVRKYPEKPRVLILGPTGISAVNIGANLKLL